MKGVVLVLLAFLVQSAFCVEKRIIGGTPAEWSEKTYLAQNLCNVNPSGPAYWVQCGCTSTIIGDKIALTAGHCLFRDFPIALRFHDGTIIPVEQICPNPGMKYQLLPDKFLYGLTTTENDLGLQILESEIPDSASIFPFLSTTDYYQENCTLNKQLAGFPGIGVMSAWGIMTDDYETGLKCFYQEPGFICPFSPDLNKIYEYQIPSEYCQFVLQDLLGIPYEVHDNIFCATPVGEVFPASLFFGDSKGGCVGDSGSPLIQTHPWTGQEVILGLYSDNFSFKDESDPQASKICGNGLDIFTRMNEELSQWVAQTVAAYHAGYGVCFPPEQ